MSINSHLGKEAVLKTIDHSSIQESDSLCRITSKEWMDSKEAAAYLSLSAGALRNLTSNGKIPYYKFFARNRYNKSELDIFLYQKPEGPERGNQTLS